MKHTLPFLAFVLSVFVNHAAPIGSGISYQGRLAEGGAPANGSFEFRFALFDSAVAGKQAGVTLTNARVSVANGLFNTMLDFGAVVFDGTQYWLEIGVRTNESRAAFTALLPRQPVLPVPYALHALNAEGVVSNAVDGVAIQDAAITAAKIANGQVVKSLNGLADDVVLTAGDNITLTPGRDGLTIEAKCCGVDDWHLTGNLGTTAGANFLGTRDDEPLELRVFNTRALRLEPTPAGAPNLIGGAAVNSLEAGVVGATIGGGGAANWLGASLMNRMGGDFGVIAGGLTNRIGNNADFSAIGGGATNAIEDVSRFSTIGGGARNLIDRGVDFSAIGGGWANAVASDAGFSVIGGGQTNRIQIDAHSSTISGGAGNLIEQNAFLSVVGGGWGNRIWFGAPHATIAGGRRNQIFNAANSATVGGGAENAISTASPYATIGGGTQNLIAPACTNATVAGGQTNRILGNALNATIGGGFDNTIWTNATASTIGGGRNNEVRPFSDLATIGGGRQNRIFAAYSTISGGDRNSIQSDSTNSTISGGFNNQIANGSDAATIGGGEGNDIGRSARGAAIAGGVSNDIREGASYSAIGGGRANFVAATNATIGGGFSNIIWGDAGHSTIGGGYFNRIETFSGVIAGGVGNAIFLTAPQATIGGGGNNLVYAINGTIGGGFDNLVTGTAATVPGGSLNRAEGHCSFAAGCRARAVHDGSFVWADDTDATFTSTAAQQFLIRASGGVGIGHPFPDAPLHVVGGTDANLTGGGTLVLGTVIGGRNVVLDNNEIQARDNAAASTLFLNASGGNVSIGTFSSTARLRVVNATCNGEVWSNSSDRNLKERFEPVDARAVLAKVAALPISRWNYTNAPGTRHLGPMAQDFQAAFGLGADDKSIATIDADGIALAAIQGLNAKLEAKEARIAALEHSLAELRQALESLKRVNGAR
jgi:hypothetical protein